MMERTIITVVTDGESVRCEDERGHVLAWTQQAGFVNEDEAVAHVVRLGLINRRRRHVHE